MAKAELTDADNLLELIDSQTGEPNISGFTDEEGNPVDESNDSNVNLPQQE